MRLVLALLFICDLRSAVAVFINNDFGDVEIGESFNITWTASTPSPVNLTLVGDSDFKNPGVLHEINRIAASTSGSSFQWIPSRDLNLSITYAMQLVDGAGDVELSQAFKLVDRGESASVTSSPSSTASAITTSIPGSSASAVTAASTQTNPPSQPQAEASSPASTATSSSQTSANIRIAVSMTIVTFLILVVVALIFYEHGKRVASRNQDSESASSSAYDPSDRGNGSDGLQLFEGFHAKEPDIASANCALGKDIPPDAGRVAVIEGVGLGIETQEERRKKMKSLQSIYELG
ncbi:hypothetical protein DL98DRAFT_591178 [Cadophora sp. DSE1049]|nr:hypothetical protein DL98DRAFT_591178 [Cadophora sp. DSE1049]